MAGDSPIFYPCLVSAGSHYVNQVQAFRLDPKFLLCVTQMLFHLFLPIKSDTFSKSSPRGGTGEVMRRRCVDGRGSMCSCLALHPDQGECHHLQPSQKNPCNHASGTI